MHIICNAPCAGRSSHISKNSKLFKFICSRELDCRRGQVFHLLTRTVKDRAWEGVANYVLSSGKENISSRGSCQAGRRGSRNGVRDKRNGTFFRSEQRLNSSIKEKPLENLEGRLIASKSLLRCYAVLDDWEVSSEGSNVGKAGGCSVTGFDFDRHRALIGSWIYSASHNHCLSSYSICQRRHI